MKKALASLAIAVVAASQTQAFDVVASLYDDPGTIIEDTILNNPFTGYVALGTFSGTPNFASDSAATLFSLWRPWLPDLTVTQAGVADYDGSLLGTPATFIPITSGNFTDVNAATASIGNSNSTNSYYVTQYEGRQIYAFVSDTQLAGNATKYGVFAFNGKNWLDDGDLGIGEVFVTLGLNETTQMTPNSTGVTLVPEPSSALLILGGLGAMALRRRRA